MGYELDELDREILNVLQEDARLSFRKIAERVDSTAVTVINHVEKMEEAGVINGYTVDLNYQELGYDVTAVIRVRVKGKHLEAIEERLGQHDNVLAVYEVTGDTDILVISRFASRKELGSFVIETLAGQDDIEETITHIAFDTYLERPHISLD